MLDFAQHELAKPLGPFSCYQILPNLRQRNIWNSSLDYALLLCLLFLSFVLIKYFIYPLFFCFCLLFISPFNQTSFFSPSLLFLFYFLIATSFFSLWPCILSCFLPLSQIYFFTTFNLSFFLSLIIITFSISSL